MLSSKEKQALHGKCYRTNNNYAHKFDTKNDPDSEIKIFNFVPTYDHWCINCPNKDAGYRCSGCKSVYFCSRKCQKEAWNVHKKHCGKNIFGFCITCCTQTGVEHKCPNCPARFCGKKCKDDLFTAHREYDCEYFKKTFGEFYLDYKD